MDQVSWQREIAENHRIYLERRAFYKKFGYDIERERSFILAQAQPISGRILEAGTGKGHFALTLARAGYSFVSFDISPEEQHFARLNLAYCGLDTQVDLCIENGEKTSFTDGSFDVVFSVNVVHHLQRPYCVVDELIRLVSFSGKLVVADFTPEGFALLDVIYRTEGKIHTVSPVGLLEVCTYLAAQGFSIRETADMYQRVIVAQKGTGAA